MVNHQNVMYMFEFSPRRRNRRNQKRQKGRARFGWYLLGGMGAVAILLALVNKGEEISNGGSFEQKAEQAFMDYWKAFGRNEKDIKSVKLAKMEMDHTYGLRNCPNYDEIVEFSMMTDELVDFTKLPLNRRKWQYQKECRWLEDALKKEPKDLTDSIMISRGILRKNWFGKLLADKLDSDTVHGVYLTRAAAHERMDSIKNVKRYHLFFNVQQRRGKPITVTFTSPVDSIDLEFESIYETEE